MDVMNKNVGWVSYKGGDTVAIDGNFPVQLNAQNNNTKKQFIGIAVTAGAAGNVLQLGSTGFNVTSIDLGSVSAFTGLIPINVPVGVNESFAVNFFDASGSGFTTPAVSFLYTYD